MKRAVIRLFGDDNGSEVTDHFPEEDSYKYVERIQRDGGIWTRRDGRVFIPLSAVRSIDFFEA